jgi:lipopolysaccharide transport system permease protein
MATTAAEPEHTIVIEPTSGSVMPRIREAHQNPEVFRYLVLRDVKVRYVQTKLGWAWTVLQPLGMLAVFAFAFRQLGNVKTDGVAYPAFAVTGLAWWTFFSRAATQAAESLIANTALLTKTSCPRLLMPLAAIAAVGFDLAITIVLAIVFATAFGEPPTWHIVFLPVVVVVGVLFTVGLGLTLSAVNVRYRDVRQALPFTIQVLLFVSPVAYSLSTLGPRAEAILALNPLVGIVEAFRWTLIDSPAPGTFEIVAALVITIGTLLFGLRYFSHFAREFADVA